MTEIILYEASEATMAVQVTLDGGDRVADPGPDGGTFSGPSTKHYHPSQKHLSRWGVGRTGNV
ncbi:hypothetical protein [Desulfomicrobium apsheronum]|uniref:hypothetical protein n=1 Tax=Desulfomicrobium apsheronum TaxID=52560 RepID=UPI001FDEAA5A|nr:hypothetical protein [Desulfomicrobium apsheronum]